MTNSEWDPAAFFHAVVANNSAATLVLVALGGLTWLIGGNILVAFHYKRRGMSAWSGFRPFASPFLKFNASEWAILAILSVVSMSLLIAATQVNAP